MTKAQATPISEHNGVQILFTPDSGRFTATPKGGTTPFSDKTLEGIRRKIDNHIRIQARRAALKVPTVLLQINDRYGWGDTFGDYDVDGDSDEDDDDRYDRESRLRARFLPGSFLGINAHTGEVSFKPDGGGKALTVEGWFFRADDPELENIRKLTEARVATARAAKRAERELDKALKEHGYRPHIGYHGGQNATERAVEVEEEFIRHLTPVPEGGPNA